MCRGPPNRPARLFLHLSQPRLIPQRRVRYEDQVPVLNQFIRFRLLRTPSPNRTAYESKARAMLDSPRRQGVKPLRQFALLVFSAASPAHGTDDVRKIVGPGCWINLRIYALPPLLGA